MDALRWRGSLLHGWGKLSGTRPLPDEARLLACAADGATIASIPAIFGKHTDNAANGQTQIDFVVYGPWNPQSNEATTYYLVLNWLGGGMQRIEIASPIALDKTSLWSKLQALPWLHFVKRGWRLVRQGRLLVVLQKAWQLMNTLWSSTRPLQPILDWATADGRSLVLVIDHDLGGGANLYRKNFLHRIAAQNQVHVLLTVHHGLLSYQLAVSRDGVTRHAYVDDLATVFHQLGQRDISRVIYNNIVSFPDPVAFVDTLASWLESAPGIEFLFLMHDHFCICPSWQLLNASGRYCGVPQTSVCDGCLPHNPVRFIEFSRDASIVSWRSSWNKLLQRANEIRCFSNATKELLLRAYRQIEPTSITVVPHQLDHVHLRPIRLQDPGFPIIGVVGEISSHKGAQIVADLAACMATSKVKFGLVIIGTIDVRLPDGVTVTGPYAPSQLPELLETHAVNVGFFPSIWPETFSYVTEELMEMQLPLLAFDLGAPGERVGKYQRGKVIPLGQAAEILNSIEKLYQAHVGNA